MSLWQIVLVSVVLNIPFGYWRENVPKFSLRWLAAIHVPVGIMIAMRVFSGIPWQWDIFLIMVAAFTVGQRLGAKCKELLPIKGSGCLCTDFYKAYLRKG